MREESAGGRERVAGGTVAPDTVRPAGDGLVGKAALRKGPRVSYVESYDEGNDDDDGDWDGGTGRALDLTGVVTHQHRHRPEPMAFVAIAVPARGGSQASCPISSPAIERAGAKKQHKPRAVAEALLNTPASECPLHLVCKDISRGEELHPIPCLALEPDERPPYFSYVSSLFYSGSRPPGVFGSTSVLAGASVSGSVGSLAVASVANSTGSSLDDMAGCDCCADGNGTSCTDERVCACARRSQVDRVLDGKPKCGFAYSKKGLLRSLVSLLCEPVALNNRSYHVARQAGQR